jgi:hypothetical protein
MLSYSIIIIKKLWTSQTKNAFPVKYDIIFNMKKIISFVIIIITVFYIDKVSAQQISPIIPPAPNLVTEETNYHKCLNGALLKREIAAKVAYQEFNLAVEPERVALEKAAKPFRGWLSWLNVFRREDLNSFERLNNEYGKALNVATPAKDMAIEKLNNKFTVDQQFCLTHQDAKYNWTSEDQKALDLLIPPRAYGNDKKEMSK